MRGLTCLLLLTTLSASAEDKVYRYVAPNGAIHYTDKPPDKNAKPVELPPLQTFKSTRGTSSAPTSSSTDTPLPPPQFSLAIDSPTPEQTYREVAPQITLSVSILPGLISGYGLVYAVDGVVQNEEPIGQTSYIVTGLDRGSHTLSATLVNSRGIEVASSSVTVHLKPPVVKP